LFSNEDLNANVFREILNDIAKENDEKKSDGNKCKFILAFDSASLIIRHFDEKPFCLINFLIEASKRPGKAQRFDPKL
jgi:hypothetical protein